MTFIKDILLKWKRHKQCLMLVVFIFLFNQNSKAQTFVQWDDGGVNCNLSTLDTITGTYPGGTVFVTNTGPGNDILLGEEYFVGYLNGATAPEVFGTYGPAGNPPARSLTFTFSIPVTIESFNMHDLNSGGGWNDALQFSGVTFTSVLTGGGCWANGNGTTVIPAIIGNGSEFAHWLNSTTQITSFSVDFQNTNGLTTAYIGYSLAVISSLNIIGESTICSGDSTLLAASSGPDHDWATLNDPGTIFSSDSAVYVSPLTTTTYVLYGSDTVNFTVDVNYPPAAFNIGNDVSVCIGDSAVIEVPINLLDSTYFWSTGDTTTNITATTEGTYSLTLTNQCGATSSSMTLSIIDCDTTVYVPNTFTPNGDHVNDFFTIKCSGTQSYSLTIVNRWGNVVFKSNDSNVHWDGMINNKKANDGTYFYKLIVGNQERHGWLQLIR